jgi:hypothetical protein
MTQARQQTFGWLIAAVVAHLAISVAHGTAHTRANVPLTPIANLFVFVVILAGPLLGLALMWVSVRTGAWLVATTMVASLVFGILNHFVFVSADHVARVDPSWQPLFAATAVLLALTEGASSVLALTLARREALS